VDKSLVSCFFDSRCSVFLIAISMLHVRLTYVIKVLLTYLLTYLLSNR